MLPDNQAIKRKTLFSLWQNQQQHLFQRQNNDESKARKFCRLRKDVSQNTNE